MGKIVDMTFLFTSAFMSKMLLVKLRFGDFPDFSDSLNSDITNKEVHESILSSN